MIMYCYNWSWLTVVELYVARGFGSVVKHSTADPGIASSTPLTKITNKEICTGSSQEKCSRVSVLYAEHVKEPGLACVLGAPVSMHYGPLIETNNMYAPTPNGQSVRVRR